VRHFIFSGSWLNKFIPEQLAPFCNAVKLHIGGCEFIFDIVVMLWISWLVVYKSLLLTTNNNTENKYLDCKGKQLSARVPTC